VQPALLGWDEEEEAAMSGDNVYKVVELVGSSPDGIEGAIQNAISRASKTLHHIGWFEVQETRGHVVDGQIKHYQVTLKLGFTLDG
jgi:dodecin